MLLMISLKSNTFQREVNPSPFFTNLYKFSYPYPIVLSLKLLISTFFHVNIHLFRYPPISEVIYILYPGNIVFLEGSWSSCQVVQVPVCGFHLSKFAVISCSFCLIQEESHLGKKKRRKCLLYLFIVLFLRAKKVFNRY